VGVAEEEQVSNAWQESGPSGLFNLSYLFGATNEKDKIAPRSS